MKISPIPGLFAVFLSLSASHAVPRAPMPPVPEMAPVLWQDHFNQPYRWGATNPPSVTVEEFGDFSESWSGYGLSRAGMFVPAYTLPGTNPDGKANFRSGSGAIRVWVSPLWSSATATNGTGPGTESRLIELSVTDGNTLPVVCWSLRMDPDGTAIRLIAESDAGSYEVLSSAIEWQAGQPHLIALNYGINGTQLFLDGQLAAQGAGTVHVPEASALLTIGSSFLGMDTAESVIDELACFARPLTAAEAAFHYSANIRHASMGPVTPEEQLARSQRTQAALTSSAVAFEGMLELDGLYGLGGEEYDTNLWIEITGVSSNEVALILHNTIVGDIYEVLATTNVVNGFWTPEPPALLAQSNQIPATVQVGERTNHLFMRARSWVDSDGSGLPDWWQLDWFEQTGVDPYGDSDEDGWSNIQEYQNGTNPVDFNTPPAPAGVQARLTSDSAALISWLQSPGPVQGYQVMKSGPPDYVPSTNYLSATQTQMTDSGLLPYLNVERLWYSYYVRAVYAGGNSQWSPEARLAPVELSPGCHLVRGPNGRLHVILSGVKSGTQAVRFTRFDTSVTPPGIEQFDIALPEFTNGVCILPEQWEPYFNASYRWWAQAVFGTNSCSDATGVGYAKWWCKATCPFYDGREAMKQNLIFQLRAANVDSELSFLWMWPLSEGWPYLLDEFWSSTNYAHSGYWDMTEPGYPPDGVAYHEEALNPFIMNHLYRNFVYSFEDVDENGWMNTGVGLTHYNEVVALFPPKYELSWPQAGSAPPVLLAAEQSEWMYPWRRWSDWDVSFGLTDPCIEDSALRLNASNLFGLHINGMLIVWSNSPSSTVLINPGEELPATEGRLYMRTAQPQLETVDYYFAQKSPYHPWLFGPAPVPGQAEFSVTNTTPLLVAALGDDTFQVGGWAKQRIVNGYSDKFAYLGQYFEKAYKLDSTGGITTNETGILSPYGEFMPLEPGPVALVTMTNWGVNERGTAVVHVISMSVDANHDGVMDLSYTGEDHATYYRPFRFWVNNDRDAQDGGDEESFKFQNCNNDVIECHRDLEDFARLWICGVPAIRSADGYRVELSIENYSGNPSLNLYRAYDSGTGYLTDTNAAAAQFTKLYLGNELIIDYAQKIATVSSGSGYSIPLDPINGGLSFDRFLFEGANKGRGRLVLTIYKDETILAQTSAYLDLRDIKEMYEQVLVTNVQQQWPEMVEESRVSGFKLHRVPEPGLEEAREVAVFVHGWRMPNWEYFNFSETMFKRLYWQGYQGRFAALRWPTRSGDTDPFLGLDYATYNRSEHIAFKSGTGTAAYLNDLRQRFPDHTISVCAHSMGNIVMMQALKELAAASQAPIDNYVLMQAAVPAQCYDTTVTNLPALMTAEQTTPTPNTYLNYASGVTNALRPGGRLLNFFNPDDFALVTGLLGGLGSWEHNQRFYIDDTNGPVTMKPNTLLGYYTDGTNSLLRTNHWNQQLAAVLYGGYYSSHPTRTVTSHHEILPFVARSRSKAVGAQAGIAGQITGNQVNLGSPSYSFTNKDYDHSGQFNRNIQEPPMWSFYPLLRSSLFP